MRYAKYNRKINNEKNKIIFTQRRSISIENFILETFINMANYNGQSLREYYEQNHHKLDGSEFLEKYKKDKNNGN